MDAATSRSTLKALANNSAYTDAQLDAAVAAALADVGQSRYRPVTTSSISLTAGIARVGIDGLVTDGLLARNVLAATLSDASATAGATLTTDLDIRSPDDISGMLRDDSSTGKPEAVSIDTSIKVVFVYPVPDAIYSILFKYCVPATLANLPDDIAQIVLGKGAFAYLMAPSDEQRKGSATYRDWLMWLAGGSLIEDGETDGAEITMNGSWDTIDPYELGVIGS